jgi:xanthine dehydrogenase large subunit
MCASQLYGGSGRNVTPYRQVEHNLLGDLIERLERSSDYARRQAIRAFNAASPVLKKGRR